MRAVIEAQLDAFRKDDAARAFSLATPGIREAFGSLENFMNMVRSAYAVVYRRRPDPGRGVYFSAATSTRSRPWRLAA